MGLVESIFGPPCIHCDHRTRNRVQGEVVCKPCELKEQASREAGMICPKCQAAMEKKIEQTVIYDKCPACGGVWLDRNELETLVGIANAVGMASGQSTGTVLGMMLSPHS